MNINWRAVKKAIVAFIGSLGTAVVTVAAAKHGDPWTNEDWLTVLAILLGVGGTTAGVWGAENEPSNGGQSGRS